jgi:hypothetical protein
MGSERRTVGPRAGPRQVLALPPRRLPPARPAPPAPNARRRLPREDARGPFVVEGSYFERRRYRDEIERDGLSMTFESRHWTLEDYCELLGGGFLLDAIRDVPGANALWERIPMFLQLRGVLAERRGKAPQPG